LNQSWCSIRIKKGAKKLLPPQNQWNFRVFHASRGQSSCREYYNFWLVQAGWPQSHSSVVSPFAASQYAEQYFWPAGAMQRQPSIAHFFASAIFFLRCYFHSDA
jgi:hypothetical protein